MKNNNDQTTTQISRREILLGLGSVAAMSLGANAMAAMPEHDHSKHATQQPAVLDAANNCTDKGARCISHCLTAWNEGDLELAACAKKVNEMNAICDGFSKLLAANSSHVKDYAKICTSVCNECAKECRKHEKHDECRACAEACEALVKAIDTHFA